MIWTIKPRKYMGRTMWVITAIFIVAILILGLLVSDLFFLFLTLLIAPLILFISDMGYRNVRVELSDDEVTFIKCAIKNTKRHDKIKIKLSEIKKAEIVSSDELGTVLIVKIDEKDDNDILVDMGCFKSKEVDRLCALLNGEVDADATEGTATKLARLERKWVIGGLAVGLVVAGIYVWFMNRTEKTGEADYDIAFVENKTQHAITLKMTVNDSVGTPWQVSVPPMSTITLKDDLNLSLISTYSPTRLNSLMLSKWPKLYIKDTVYVYFDDSIMVPHYRAYDSISSQFVPQKCFLDNNQWRRKKVLVKTKHELSGSRYNRRHKTTDFYRIRYTYTFDANDYLTAEGYSKKKGI